MHEVLLATVLKPQCQKLYIKNTSFIKTGGGWEEAVLVEGSEH